MSVTEARLLSQRGIISSIASSTPAVDGFLPDTKRHGQDRISSCNNFVQTKTELSINSQKKKGKLLLSW
jgi:hypothetical protein